MSRTHDMTHLINDPFHDGVRSRFTPTERSGGSPDGTAVGLPIVLTPYRPIGFTLIPAMVQGKITCSSQIGILFDYRTTRPKARGRKRASGHRQYSEPATAILYVTPVKTSKISFADDPRLEG